MNLDDSDIHLQIFEWCHYIDLSGDVHALLVEMYKNNIPRYGELFVRYKTGAQKSSKSKTKITF